MKFQRTDLIARVEAEIERRQQDASEQDTKDLKAHEKNLQQYLDRSGPAWSELATTIRRRQRNGQPMTVKDIPDVLRNGHSYGYVTTWDKTTPTKRVANTQKLALLLELLNASTDDEVSDVALQRMGFRMGDLFPGR